MLIDKLLTRLLRLGSKGDKTLISKAIKHITEKIIPEYDQNRQSNTIINKSRQYNNATYVFNSLY